jgi:hypothetical protein
VRVRQTRDTRGDMETANIRILPLASVNPRFLVSLMLSVHLISLLVLFTLHYSLILFLFIFGFILLFIRITFFYLSFSFLYYVFYFYLSLGFLFSG